MIKSYYSAILNLPIEKWDYYYEIDRTGRMELPFGDRPTYGRFIRSFFERGGKVKIFKECRIDPNNLYRPNHICSVFFLGILMYYKTSLHKQYKKRKNAPGYQNFPFIWFLIALFHDNGCRMEEDKDLLHIKSLADLKKHYEIDHDLLEHEFRSCFHLAESRPYYFHYIREKHEKIEHGILAALLLYDRLVKIRRKKQTDEPPDERLFWDESLEDDYRLAAQAISLHNIWLPKTKDEPVYKEYHLEKLIGSPKVKFADFPLYYILAVVDSIEPVKQFWKEHPDMYILENVRISFKKDGILVENTTGSTLDFESYITKVKSLEDWLEIKVDERKNGFELSFQ